MMSFKLGVKYLQLWRDNLKSTLIEKKKLQKAKLVIDRLKKKQVFKQLKSIVVRL